MPPGPPTFGAVILIYTFLGLASFVMLASLAIAEPIAITESTRLKNIIFFIVVIIKGF